MLEFSNRAGQRPQRHEYLRCSGFGKIAVVLGSVVNGFVNFIDADAYHLATHQNRVLAERGGSRGAGKHASWKRAITSGIYIAQIMSFQNPSQPTRSGWPRPHGSRTIRWMDSRYASLVTAGEMPRDNPQYRPGRIVWTDWKPVTGENAWAYLLGRCTPRTFTMLSGKGKSACHSRSWRSAMHSRSCPLSRLCSRRSARLLRSVAHLEE